jgi:3',5'-cyclic AMP phosphodiesterase CpdA
VLKFIHLTDTHLVAPGRSLYGTDPAWRLRQAIDAINAEHPDAAFTIVTGDLAHWGESEAYGALAEELARLRMPVHLAIGNHDDRAAFVRAFPQLPTSAGGWVQYAFEAGGLHHIVLDTNEPGVSWGVFCPLRARWLADELARRPDRPVHLYLHHPPCPVGIPAMDRISLLDVQPLREVLLAHRERIRHLFFGHLHRPIAGSWLGMPLSTVRATNHQVALRLHDSARVAGSHEPAQFAVVLADAEQTIVHLHDFADRSARFDL